MPSSNPVSDFVSNLADKYKAGDKQTSGMGAELGARAEMNRQAERALAPSTPAPAAASAPAREVGGTPVKGPYGSERGEKRIDTSSMTKPLGSFKKGTDSVPKTGMYKLHEGEKVTPEEKNPDSKKGDKMATPFDMVTGGKKAPKTIQKHEYSKTHNGKHVVTHKHHSADHKDETHMFDKFSEAADHMNSNPPQPEQEMPAAEPAAGAAGAAPSGM